jgi:hypothetical protein
VGEQCEDHTRVQREHRATSDGPCQRRVSAVGAADIGRQDEQRPGDHDADGPECRPLADSAGRPRIAQLNQTLAEQMQAIDASGHHEIFDTDVRGRIAEALEEPPVARVLSGPVKGSSTGLTGLAYAHVPGG